VKNEKHPHPHITCLFFFLRTLAANSTTHSTHITLNQYRIQIFFIYFALPRVIGVASEKDIKIIKKCLSKKHKQAEERQRINRKNRAPFSV